MAGLTFRDRLEQEFADRRAINKRYSLRAFAGLLGTDHATVSQILRRKRSVPHERIAAWARKLKLSPEEIAVYTAVERVIDENKRRQSEQLRHWASEMLALLNEPVHREILRLLRRPDFKPDSRWIAAETRAALDHVNIAISRLVGFGLLEMGRAGKWADKTGLAEITPKDFRKYIAERVPNPLLKEGA